MQHRRDTLRMIGGAMALAAAPALAKPAQRPPNIIVVVADDLGWGDLGSYGNRQIATPNLDRMAREGLRMTDFHASANVCTPSRAGLMTGRYPIRTGLGYDVIQAKDTNGLPLSEVTLAAALRPTYATGLFGKWHLGHTAPYWPPAVHGFDRYFGIPYSNDMQPLALYSSGVGNELTSSPVDQTRLTEQFFGAATDFITQNKAKPFLAMVMLSAPHQPLFPRKLGDGAAGKYGDVVGEIDAGMGRLFATLKQLGLDRDTMVIFTSDNGPWFQGSAGGFRDRKGGAGWEGGHRVPLIVRQQLHLGAGAGRDRHGNEAEGRDRAGREDRAHRVRRSVDQRVFQGTAVLDSPLHVSRHDHAVEHGDARERDEPDGGWDAEGEAAPHQPEDAADQRERHHREDRGCVPCALEHREQHAKDDRERHRDHQREPLLGALEVLELPAPLDGVTGGELHVKPTRRTWVGPSVSSIFATSESGTVRPPAASTKSSPSASGEAVRGGATSRRSNLRWPS